MSTLRPLGLAVAALALALAGTGTGVGASGTGVGASGTAVGASGTGVDAASGGIAAPVAAAGSPAQAGQTRVSTRRLLRELAVQPEDRAPYDRRSFRHWIDADQNNCDTRREVLLQEALRRPVISNPATCSFRWGTGLWRSLYDGRYFSTATVNLLAVDHVVSLSEAWDSGARGWPAKRRRAFANDLRDPRTLRAISFSINEEKSADDQWLPPQGKCVHLADTVAVKYRWRLSVDPSERRFLREGLRECGWPRIVTPKRVRPL